MSKKNVPKKRERDGRSRPVVAKLKLKPGDLCEPDEPSTDDDSFDDIFGNDGAKQTACRRCDHLKKAVEDLENQLSQYQNKEQAGCAMLHKNNVSLICHMTGKKIKMRKTEILCWWDCHQFDTYPCMLPMSVHDGSYRVMGCFCSFNCMLAYNLYTMADELVHQRRSLALQMYREMFKVPITQPVSIHEAPPREQLAAFGGDTDIDDYRSGFSLSRRSWRVVEPIQFLDITVVEGEDPEPIQRSGYAISRQSIPDKRNLYQFRRD